MRVAPTSNSNGLLAIGAQPLVEEADADFEVVLAEAIELHGRTPTPFESARTELCLGERLRRARRRADVRAPLRSALESSSGSARRGAVGRACKA